MIGRVDGELLQVIENFTCQRVHFDDAFNFIAEELDANRRFFIGRNKFEGVAANPELGSSQVHVVALVLHVHQLADQLASVATFADFHLGNQVEVIVRITQTVNTRN